MDKSSTHPNSMAAQVINQTQAVTSETSPAGLKRFTSRELFSGARELVIEHAGDEYRLRLTNQGKLILTK